MPKIEPIYSGVSWPKEEGTLGVVGVAPWATLEFCHSFYSFVKAKKDWDYPRVLLDINTKLPSRGRHLQLGERDPSPYISETITELANAGATVAVVACNTAHILYDRWASNAPIPVLNIIDTVIAEALYLHASKVVALASRSLVEYDLYGSKSEAAGLSYQRLPSSIQELVFHFIEQVKIAGRLSEEDEEALNLLICHLRAQQLDTIFLGCTELSILKKPLIKEGYRVIDSNMALAKAAYAAIRGPGV
jgi:aspartate racemase